MDTLLATASPDPDDDFAAIITAGWTLPVPPERQARNPGEVILPDPLIAGEAMGLSR